MRKPLLDVKPANDQLFRCRPCAKLEEGGRRAPEVLPSRWGSGICARTSGTRIQNVPFRVYGDVAERLKAAVC
jgi:hypothetical protein